MGIEFVITCHMNREEFCSFTIERRGFKYFQEMEKRAPVFVQPLSAPPPCQEGDSAHFAARYEPVNDNELKILWFFNGNPLKTGSRVKTISDFGFVVLEISPVYPEDTGEYICKAVNSKGEAVTSAKLQCEPRANLILYSQLPDRMQGAQKKIEEIEAPKPLPPEPAGPDYGGPKLVPLYLMPYGKLIFLIF